LLLTALLFCVSCKPWITRNFFNDLIPPDGDRILSFSVPGLVGNALIGDDTVTAFTYPETSLYSLVPGIEVPSKAKVIPITYAYIQEAFKDTDIDIMSELFAFYNTENIHEFVSALIQKYPNCRIPPISLPIDFSMSVPVVVIGGQGSVRWYTVSVGHDIGAAKLRSFGFTKFDNPELTKNAIGVFNEADKTIEITAYYPAEYHPSGTLIPAFDVVGGALLDEAAELHSESSEMAFAEIWDSPQTRTLKARREGYADVEYRLKVTFVRDPDTVRSITDFRFDKAENGGILITALGFIRDTGDTGAIDIAVYYDGQTPPVNLAPRFISPGTVSAASVVQTSGESRHDFSAPLAYHVVSRDGRYERDYTVNVTFIPLSAVLPKITEFGFGKTRNVSLAKNSAAAINDKAQLIEVIVEYTGDAPPVTLMPYFTATGIVRSGGIIQQSDVSSQDFSRSVKYTVSDPAQSAFSRDYWVQAHFVENPGADASITAFGFHAQEGLGADVTGVIDQEQGTITLVFPNGTDLTRSFVPHFTSRGTVQAEGGAQTSGESGRRFDSPVVYTVTSADGTNTRTYTVSAAEDPGTGKLLAFRFSRFDNPDLSREAYGTINADKVSITAYYPPEAAPPASLRAAFDMWGDSLAAAGGPGKPDTPLVSGSTALAFAPGTTPMTLKVLRAGFPDAAYSLTVHLLPDPLMQRQLTAFSFDTAYAENARLVFSSVVINDYGDSNTPNAAGAIAVDAYYLGERPAALRPTFERTGTGEVSVNGAGQVSGLSANAFEGPVVYHVVSQDGQWTRDYTVTINIKLFSFAFSRGKNPALSRETAAGVIDPIAKTITVTAYLPDELASPPAALVPGFDTWGDSVVLADTNTPLTSGVTGISFTRAYDLEQTKNLQIKRTGFETEAYRLRVTFLKDPHTVRRITDFGFEVNGSPGVTSISNLVISDEDAPSERGASGTITLAALYVVTLPTKARFASEGAVSVGGVPQESGVSEQDFLGTSLVYHVVSPDGNWTRDYTVTVDLREDPKTIEMTSFRFDSGIAANKGITSTAPAVITNDDDTGTISLTAVYIKDRPAIPSFTLADSHGTVRIGGAGGAAQTSGVTAQVFGVGKTTLHYYVESPDRTIQRDYTAEITLLEDESTRALFSFTFETEGNPGDITNVGAASIQNNGDTGTITINVSYMGTEPTTLVPTFSTGAGTTVYVGAAPDAAKQTSGLSSQDFSAPVVYTVVSPDATLSRAYTVTVTFTTLKINSFTVTRANNPAMTKDAQVTLDEGSKMITINAYFPDESTLPATVALKPSFTMEGDGLYEGDTLLVSDSSPLAFTSSYPYARSLDIIKSVIWVFSDYDMKTLTVKRSGFPDTTYRIQAIMRIDLDTVRRINSFTFAYNSGADYTGFRTYGYGSANPGLTYSYCMDIDQGTAGGATGSITVWAYNFAETTLSYAGYAMQFSSFGVPSVSSLKPFFMAGPYGDTNYGVVKVGGPNGTIQTSGVSSQDFSSPVEYTVVSNDGNYYRTYTVTVKPGIAEEYSPGVASFSIAQTETTYGLWSVVYAWGGTHGYTFANAGRAGSSGGYYDSNPSLRNQIPVTGINWRDAMIWCNAASEMAGRTPVYYTDESCTSVQRVSTNDSGNTTADNVYVKADANGFRLPDTWEWAVAARGGVPYSTEWNYSYSGSSNVDEVAWWNGNAGDDLEGGSSNPNYGVHAVATRAPNSAGIYDMSGNVSEWCFTLLSDGLNRSILGGSWYQARTLLVRWYGNSYTRYKGVGFRVVCNAQ
jgi:formylglycine-generating enzyme required for sulfatase activity